jgi:hypothetical protein
MKPTKGARNVYDYGARNSILLGHILLVEYQTTAEKEISNLGIHPVFMNRPKKLISLSLSYSQVMIEKTGTSWTKVQLTDEGYGFSPPQGPKMDPNEVGKAAVWRGRIYTFPASKTDQMREFLRKLFA